VTLAPCIPAESGQPAYDAFPFRSALGYWTA
jgi:hypothetical protein